MRTTQPPPFFPAALRLSAITKFGPKCRRLVLLDKEIDCAFSPLQACRYGRVQHLEHLLYYGADIDVQNASGNTPLHVCAAYNQVRKEKLVVVVVLQKLL